MPSSTTTSASALCRPGDGILPAYTHGWTLPFERSCWLVQAKEYIHGQIASLDSIHPSRKSCTEWHRRRMAPPASTVTSAWLKRVISSMHMVHRRVASPRKPKEAVRPSPEHRSWRRRCQPSWLYVESRVVQSKRANLSSLRSRSQYPC